MLRARVTSKNGTTERGPAENGRASCRRTYHSSRSGSPGSLPRDGRRTRKGLIMLSQIGLFLLDVLLLPFTGIVLLRFHAVWMGVPMRNPVGEFVMAITDFAVLPLRRNLPSLGRFDLASFVVSAALAWLYLLAALWLKGYPSISFPAWPCCCGRPCNSPD